MPNPPSQPDHLKADHLKPDHLRPEMPRIPGVSDRPAAKRGAFSMAFSPLRWGMPLAALCLAGGLGWWAMHASRGNAAAGAPAATDAIPAVAAPAEAPDPPPAAVAAPKLTRSGATVAASVAELAKPWSAKRFTFADPETHRDVAAMVVRLPGAANSRESYWAFSLAAPFQTSCELEYMADAAQVSARFGYRAGHPMVVSACDGAVYDPLRTQTVGSGAWVRGEVVSGAALRPPLSIDVAVEGDAIVADRME